MMSVLMCVGLVCTTLIWLIRHWIFCPAQAVDNLKEFSSKQPEQNEASHQNMSYTEKKVAGDKGETAESHYEVVIQDPINASQVSTSDQNQTKGSTSKVESEDVEPKCSPKTSVAPLTYTETPNRLRATFEEWINSPSSHGIDYQEGLREYRLFIGRRPRRVLFPPIEMND